MAVDTITVTGKRSNLFDAAFAHLMEKKSPQDVDIDTINVTGKRSPQDMEIETINVTG